MIFIQIDKQLHIAYYIIYSILHGKLLLHNSEMSIKLRKSFFKPLHPFQYFSEPEELLLSIVLLLPPFDINELQKSKSG